MQSRPLNRPFYRFFKRLFDLVSSSLALVVLSPLLIAFAVIIKLTSPGTVLYRGVRTGLSGAPFRILKYRTMVMNADNLGGPSAALDDPRITGIGMFLRKYKLDELPQLINVLRGEMSVVGPRPQVAKYTDLYNDEEKIMLEVKPGMTDYASVKFIHQAALLGNEDVDDRYYREIEPAKNKLRIRYALECSMWVDVKIIVLTVLHLFRINSLWEAQE